MQKLSTGKYPQALRIIGGRWRGRTFSIPNIPALRPTPNRIRETLFNWLGKNILHRHCLDIFSGSGALGLEALSRGAAHGTFVDDNSLAVEHLQKSLAFIDKDNYHIIHDNALHYLSQRNHRKYNMIFVDPPFNKGLVEETCQLIEKNNWLDESSLVYIEHESSLPQLSIPKHWHLEKESSAGQVCCKLYLAQMHSN